MSEPKWNMPKLVIEIGGPPPKKGSWTPWFFINWYNGSEHTRKQFTIMLPFFALRFYPLEKI